MVGDESISRSVSFSNSLTTVITYVDKPKDLFVTADSADIIDKYRSCSFRYNCKPLPTVINQLEELTPTDNRYPLLDLSHLRLNLNQVEALEEVFRRARFISISLENSYIDEEAAVSFFEILIFYDSAIKLNLSALRGMGPRSWVSFTKLLRRSTCVTHVDLNRVNFDYDAMLYFTRVFRYGTHVNVLHLENINANGVNLSEIVNGIRNNTSIRELYLGGNGITLDDTAYLKYLMLGQIRLRLLDLSNNDLKDIGLVSFLTGLSENYSSLAHLHLSKNAITSMSMPTLSSFITNTRIKCLTLNDNPIGDEGLAELKPGLLKCHHLCRLELRNCLQMTEGVIALSEFLAESKIISQIDLRGNTLKIAAYYGLICSLRFNRSLNQLLLDSSGNGRNSNGEELRAISVIEKMLERNRMDWRESDETASVNSYETSSLIEYSGALAAVTSTGNFIVTASSKVFRSIKGLLLGISNKVQNKEEAVEQTVQFDRVGENASLDFGSVEIKMEDTFGENTVEVGCNGNSDDDFHEFEDDM